MVIFGITIIHLAGGLQVAEPGLLTPFYADDAAFDGSARRSAHILKLLMDMGPDWGYFPKPAKSLLITDSPEQEEAEKMEFVVEGLYLNCFSGSQCLGAYLGPWE